MNRKLKLDELKRDSIEDFKSKSKQPVIIVLDHIRSLNNVGSFFRTADAFNIEKIYLCGITATPPHREIRKTALGATESVDWEYVENTIDVIKKYNALGYKTVAVEQAVKTILLQHFKVGNQGTVFVFGNEVDGVSDDVIAICNEVLEIPQFGTKHSLNVSVCGGAVLWEATKQNLSKG